MNGRIALTALGALCSSEVALHTYKAPRESPVTTAGNAVLPGLLNPKHKADGRPAQASTAAPIATTPVEKPRASKHL